MPGMLISGYAALLGMFELTYLSLSLTYRQQGSFFPQCNVGPLKLRTVIVIVVCEAFQEPGLPLSRPHG